MNWYRRSSQILWSCHCQNELNLGTNRGLIMGRGVGWVVTTLLKTYSK